MSVRIAVVSDTHCYRWEEVHPRIREEIADADIAVHCGDFTRLDVLEGIQRTAKRSVVVHGNSDPVELRQAIPYVETIEVESKRIGIIHPAWGGPPFELEELFDDFLEPVDVILFGHLHETVNEVREGVLFVNPGQGYSSFMVPATIALLTIDNGDVSVEIRTIEPGS